MERLYCDLERLYCDWVEMVWVPFCYRNAGTFFPAIRRSPFWAHAEYAGNYCFFSQ